MGGVISSEEPSKDEQGATDPSSVESAQPTSNSKEDWVVIEESGEMKIEPPPTHTEPQAKASNGPVYSPSVESPGNYPTPQGAGIDRSAWRKRPADLELPSSKSIPTLPSIEEEDLHELYGSELPSLEPHTDHYRSPSADSRLFAEMSPTPSLESRHTPLRSQTPSLDSKCLDKSRSPSVESRTSQLSETLCFEPGELSEMPGSRHSHSPELPTDLDTARPPSDTHSNAESERLFLDEFQLSDMSANSSFQGSFVDSILVKTKKALRDDGLTAAVKYVHTRLEQDSDLQVAKSLLHKACNAGTDVCTFNIALMKIDKTMLNYPNERLNGRTPLHVACSYLPVDVSERTRAQEKQQLIKIAKLLSRGAGCIKQDKDGNTPLHLATFHNNAECVRLILEHNVDCINMGNNLGNTALHIACRDNFVGVVKALCEHKANAQLSNSTKKQRCPLHQAISKGHTKVVELLLNYDPRLVECADSKRMLPLHLAVKRDCPTIAHCLLKQVYCPVTSVDCEGKTPLHYASELGSAELVAMLLKRDSSRSFVNAQDSNGDTALHLACRHGNEAVKSKLKAKNASKKITNNQGETPKEAAINAGHKLPPKKGVKKLWKKHKDFIPSISAADPLVSSKTSAQTPPLSGGPGTTD